MTTASGAPAGVPPTSPPADRHRVVIIGTGFGGLFATQALKRADVDITLIGNTTAHLFQPLLYQVATGILSEGEIAPAAREVLRRQRNVTTLLGEVDEIDLTARTVTSTSLGRRLVSSYDSLIVAAGAGQSYFGNDQFAQYAPGMKDIDNALELRGLILGCFEQAELAALRGDKQAVARLLSFVVVGAGPTGVEMAGQIAELSMRTLKRDFRHIDPSATHVVLVDGASQVLPAFGERLGELAQRRLEKMGVEVRLGGMVVDVDATGIEIREGTGDDAYTRRIESVCKVWAAGVQASELGRTLSAQTGAALDRSGRIAVLPDLTLPGHPEVHVVGDMISLDHLPGVAQVAIQGARFSAKQIGRRLDGQPTDEAFHYKDKGSMATISRFSAVASIGNLRFGGFVAWLLWLAVHLVYIIGFKSRVTTLLHWAVSFVGRGRSERTITEQQVFARRAIQQLGQQHQPQLPDTRGT
ncbi:MAG: NAD(P)/FAD-dependent oxidoreductase [Lapillicoccus sp.]